MKILLATTLASAALAGSSALPALSAEPHAAGATAARAEPIAARAGDLAAILGRQIQEMNDAVAVGDAKVWARYLAPDVTYAAEDGVIKNRTQLLAELKPLPKNVWGKLKVTDLRVVPHGDTAIATYVLDETEGYFGQVLHARYLETDTWSRTPDGWHLIAAQVLALLKDPPAIRLPAARLDELTGVYELTPEIRYTIRRKGDALLGQRTGRAEDSLSVEASDVLFVPGQPRLRKIFQRAPDGHITGFVERRESWDVLWKRLP